MVAQSGNVGNYAKQKSERDSEILAENYTKIIQSVPIIVYVKVTVREGRALEVGTIPIYHERWSSLLNLGTRSSTRETGYSGLSH